MGSQHKKMYYGISENFMWRHTIRLMSQKVIFGKLRKHLGQLFHELAKQKGCKIEEGHLMSDHVHMCISIPPKYAVSNVVGFIKGKSAISIARQFMGKTKNFTGENFWARG